MLVCTAGCMGGGWLVRSSNADDQRFRTCQTFFQVSWNRIKTVGKSYGGNNTDNKHDDNSRPCSIAMSSVTRPGLNVVD